MRIAVAWDWQNEPMQLYGWQDGIAKMIFELGKKAEVKVYTQVYRIEKETVFNNGLFDIFAYKDYTQMQEQIDSDKPDVVLFWADQTRPAITYLTERYPSGILFAGGEPILENTSRFGVIFTESAVYTERLQVAGFNVVQAFGTNTELFRPKQQPKIFDALFPACFADWKRHGLFAEAVKGMKAMACGWFQAHEPWCYEACQKAGVLTLPNVTSNLLPDFYNSSKVILITSDSSGGSQRTVLEAMSCNVPCIVMSDSDKTSEYMREAGYEWLICAPDAQSIRNKMKEIEGKAVNTRDWILQNYSEFTYADKVYKGLCQLLA